MTTEEHFEQRPATSVGAADTRQARIYRAKRPMMAGRKYQDDVTIASGKVGDHRFIVSLARNDHGYGAIVAWETPCFVDGTAHSIEARTPEEAKAAARAWIERAFADPVTLDKADPASLDIVDLVTTNDDEEEEEEEEE